MGIKQYTIHSSSIGSNHTVTTYIDGIELDSKKVHVSKLDSYCDDLEAKGFSEAYNVDKAYIDMMRAKQLFEVYKDIYDKAVEHPLIKPVK